MAVVRALSAEAVIPNLSDSVTLCWPGDAGGGCSWWVGTACWLDWMTSGVFANLNGSIILWRKTGNLLTSISAKALLQSVLHALEQCTRLQSTSSGGWQLAPSASLWLFSVHDKTTQKGSMKATGRVRRNTIPYLLHA